MEKIFRRATQGASLGGYYRGCNRGNHWSRINASCRQIAVPVIVALAVSSASEGGASAGAIGTLISGSVSAVSKTTETIHDNKRNVSDK